jgi:hypothetical protein
MFLIRLIKLSASSNNRIGIPPKQFLHIIRFDRSFRMKNRFPDKDWFSIAIDCGYQDYQHLAKDYKAFTGYTVLRSIYLKSERKINRNRRQEILLNLRSNALFLHTNIVGNNEV